MKHCIDKLTELIAADRNDRKAVLQIGYNLGRLSELTGLGREPFWDRWKDPIAQWDRERLKELVQELHLLESSSE